MSVFSLELRDSAWKLKLIIGSLEILLRPSRAMLPYVFCLASRISTSFRLSVAAFGFIKHVVSEPLLMRWNKNPALHVRHTPPLQYRSSRTMQHALLTMRHALLTMRHASSIAWPECAYQVGGGVDRCAN